MIVLRRLAHGVWDHAGVRFTEWLGAAPLMGIGIVLYALPEALYSTPSFATLATWAGAGVWSNVLMACALARLVALFVNGTFRGFTHSPTIRFVASCIAAWFWLLFTVGIYTAWRESGGSPTGVVAYGTFILLELRNAYVSRVDMASARGGRLMLGLTAEQIGTVILGLSMGLIAIMGGQKGKQVAQGRKETPSEMIEVAGAIVSDKAVERMVQSMDALSASNTMLSHAINTDVEAKKALTAAMSENSRALNRNSDVSEDMREQIKDAESKIDRLREELFRSSVSHGGGAR